MIALLFAFFGSALFGSALDGQSIASPSVSELRNLGREQLRNNQLAEAVVSFRRASDRAPWDAGARADLETLRRWLGTASPPRSVRERIGPFEVWLCAILAATLVTYGEIRSRLTGRQRWRVLTVAGVFIWLGLLALTCPQHSWPFAVVKSKQTGLRTGNSELYEFVPEGTLPVGSEVTIHGWRGGWARVQTMDGRRGWIADVDLLVDEASQNEINAGNR